METVRNPPIMWRNRDSLPLRRFTALDLLRPVSRGSGVQNIGALPT